MKFLIFYINLLSIYDFMCYMYVIFIILLCLILLDGFMENKLLEWGYIVVSKCLMVGFIERILFYGYTGMFSDVSFIFTFTFLHFIDSLLYTQLFLLLISSASSLSQSTNTILLCEGTIKIKRLITNYGSQLSLLLVLLRHNFYKLHF